MKKLMVIALVMVVLGIVPVGAVPPIPNPPTPPPTPPETPEPPPEEPSGGGGVPFIDTQKKFEVISAEPVMEGYAGSSIEYNLKVIQKGYPDLEVHLTADVPDKWKASFSKNDFELSPEESVELRLKLLPPESISTEKHEIKIHAVGKAKEDSVEVEDSLTLTAMTYLIDVGVVNFQMQPPQPRIGEPVTITVTAVNYTQREMSNVTVELLVNNTLVSRQMVTLPAGVSQPMTFGWTAAAGSSTLVVRAQIAGDTNRKNDSVNFSVSIGTDTSQADALYQQAMSFYLQENYSAAVNLFSNAAAQYTEAGETNKAAEAYRLEDICNSYMAAQGLMDQGEQALLMGENEQAAQYFTQARDMYAQLGDTEKQTYAQERLDGIKSGFNPLYLVIGAVAVVAVVAFMLSRRRGPRPAERAPSTRFRLEEPPVQPTPRPVSTSAREAVPPAREPPADLVQFHQKTEDALSRFSKGYIRDNLQQAMRVYLSLEGEKKQLPRGKDLELERIINTNLKELEHRIFGTF